MVNRNVFNGLLAALLILLAPAPAQNLDDGGNTARWTTTASANVEVHISSETVEQEKALRVDFDFHGGAGYCIVAQQVRLRLPDDYRISFRLRGTAPANNLELKLVDTTGENVWWHVRRAYAFPANRTTLASRKRQFGFAWGPLAGGDLRMLGRLEFAISAATGGKGTIWIDHLTLEDRSTSGGPERIAFHRGKGIRTPEKNHVLINGIPVSSTPDSNPGHTGTAWISFSRPRELGGLSVEFDPQRAPAMLDVDFRSDDGGWTKAIRNCRVLDGKLITYLPEAEARDLRIECVPSGSPYVLRRIDILPVDSSITPNAFFETVARRSARGLFPRYFIGEQAYWTVVGVDRDASESLLSEDGTVELERGGPSIEPFLTLNGRFVSWSGVRMRHRLEEGVLPQPTVTWDAEGLQLEVSPVAAGETPGSYLLVPYRLRNTGAQRVAGRLFLAVRPFQVNPTWQNLNSTSGVSLISSLRMTRTECLINGATKLFLPERAAVAGVTSWNNGDITAYLTHNAVPADSEIVDPVGFASGAFAYPFDLARGEEKTVTVAFPYHAGAMGRMPWASRPIDQFADSVRRQMATWWRGAISGVQLRIPGPDSVYASIVRSTLAYVLINRDGPAIQPGSRVYERSWIRDGCLTAGGFLRFGRPDIAREFITWYAGYQFPSGKIPCVVDKRGADPVAEHDSPGEFIYAVDEYVRFTGDTAVGRALYPNVIRSISYIDSLRATRMTPEYREGTQRDYYGLLPESISHEGYSDKPRHSFWDDFFALRGLQDASGLAALLGDTERAGRYRTDADTFARQIRSSLVRTMERKGIDYIPGCVELGDFDATSTAIALNIDVDTGAVPRAGLMRTFDRYMTFVRDRRDGKLAWVNYTPYELRNAHALIRLGRSEDAHELLTFLLRDMRPSGWNEWAEIVWKNDREPRYIGDIPHTWCGTEFVLAVRSMFVFEAEGALVVGAGLKQDWLSDPSGVESGDLPVKGGRVGFHAHSAQGTIRLEIRGEFRSGMPRIVLGSPLLRGAKGVKANGKDVTKVAATGFEVDRFPCIVVIEN